MNKENCACEKAGYKEHCLACKVNGLCLCGIPREVVINSNQPKEEALAYSPSVNIIRKILAKHITEWSNEMLCELANSIDLAVKNREAELIEEIEEEINGMSSVSETDNEIYQAQHLGYKMALKRLLTKLKNK